MTPSLVVVPDDERLAEEGNTYTLVVLIVCTTRRAA